MKKSDFPIFKRKINGKRLVYLDNAATSQKPRAVLDSLKNYYEKHNANVHRGIHTLSEEATELYEDARKTVSEFIGATDRSELVFTSGTTQSLNMTARFSVQLAPKTARILLSEAEHHSNVVVWQEIAKKNKCVLNYIPVDKNGVLDWKYIEKAGRIDIFSITHVSNVTGEVVNLKKVIKKVKSSNPEALVVVDGAQAVPHMKVNVSALGCDFYAFSSHKMCGPTGSGALWIKRNVAEKIHPVIFGGGMINTVCKSHSTFAKIPERFEAGTPNIAGAVGFASACRYLESVGLEKIQKEVKFLGKSAYDRLSEIHGVSIIGPKEGGRRSGIVSFTVSGVHGHDVASVLDSLGIAVRSGHHCAMILHKKLEIPSSVRASFYFYNDKKDVDALVKGIHKVKRIFGV